MSVAQVVIVGRPNVGKSSIFKWLAGRRLAIVDDVAGITRDRMTCVVEHEDRRFELVDTGGIGINDVDDLTDEIEEQIAIAMHAAPTAVKRLNFPISRRAVISHPPRIVRSKKFYCNSLSPSCTPLPRSHWAPRRYLRIGRDIVAAGRTCGGTPDRCS